MSRAELSRSGSPSSPARDAHSIPLRTLARHRGQRQLRCTSGSAFHPQCPDQQFLLRCIQGRLFQSSLCPPSPVAERSVGRVVFLRHTRPLPGSAQLAILRACCREVAGQRSDPHYRALHPDPRIEALGRTAVGSRDQARRLPADRLQAGRQFTSFHTPRPCVRALRCRSVSPDFFSQVSE
jgi:hypothetical protein